MTSRVHPARRQRLSRARALCDREELPGKRPDRGIVAPGQRVLRDKLGTDADRGRPRSEHIRHVVERHTASRYERDVGKWPPERPYIPRSADALRRKDLDHVAAATKRLEDFARRERARKHRNISATRGIDYFR